MKIKYTYIFIYILILQIFFLKNNIIKFCCFPELKTNNFLMNFKNIIIYNLNEKIES